ncbi:MAG: helix-turn-helix domain-containing protein [Megasphaera sp.]|uniref:LexA family protein n=1 Tax=Megasphaera sp. TaxID=2023260 RepID=UPI0025BFA7B6|nr:XRE family transcriptional regulator [Megasphaera sp.]MCI7600803.1 helix-turn-helix domain-containing protein [Megasphaera sp.]
MSFGAKLKKCRKDMSLSQKEFGQKIGVAESTVSLYESNKRFPDADTLKKISALFEVSLDYLLGNAPAKTVQQKTTGRGVRIPVLGRVVAGIPIEAVEEILDYEEITPELAATGEFFALQVKGDSMLPKLEEGDVVIVKKQEDVETGDIAIVLVNGDEATIKQVKKVNGGIMLYGFNPDVYEPHFYSNQQIEELPVRILGKVIESRRSW